MQPKRIRPKRVGSRTLGVVLVLAGATQLYAQQTGIAIDLSRLWPALLIILGVEILWANWAAGGGRVSYSVLALILVVVVASWAGMAGAISGPIRFTTSPKHVDDRGRLDIDWSGVTALDIELRFGSIDLRAAAPGEDPWVELEVVGHGPSAAAARQKASNATLVIERTDEGHLSLVDQDLRATAAAEWGAALNLVVAAPPELDLAVSTEHASALISGLQGEVRAESRHGDISVTEVVGAGHIFAHHGDVRLRQVAGPVSVKATYGDIRLEDIEGPVDGDAKHGDVEMSSLTGAAAVEATYGDVDARFDSPLAGPLDLRSQYGNVSLTLPSASSIKLDATAERSRVQTNLESPAGSVFKHWSRSRAVGELNDGEHEVSLFSEFGRVNIQGR